MTSLRAQSAAGPAPRDLPRRIGFWSATAVMVGIIVGSGIFRTPSDIARNLSHPGLILGLWALGGVLSLFGALTFAELATRFPRSGGVYVFLHEGMGAPVAFVFGWTYTLVTKPFGAAGVAIMASELLLRLCGFEPATPGGRWLLVQVTTCVILVVLTAVSVPGVRTGAALAKVLTGLKFGALAAIVVLALVMGRGDSANLLPQAAGGDGGASKPLLGVFVAVMAAILWTYDGWNDVGSIAGEVRNPQRTLPRVFLAGIVATTGLYVAVNAVYMWMVPLREMARVDSVAPLVVERLVGKWGERAVAVVIVVSALGSSLGSVITGARVTFAQARDGLLFRFLGRIHPRWETPAVALWVQCLLSVAAVWTAGTFDRLAGGFVFTMWIFYGLAAASIFVFRAREARWLGNEPRAQATGGFAGAEHPSLALRARSDPRVFRCPGYPFVPIVFIASALGMTVLSIAESPRQTLPWLGVLAAGLPVYLMWREFFSTGRGAAAAGPGGA